MEWAAANLSRSFEDDDSIGGSDSDSSNELTNNQRRSKRRRTTSETPEAAIARLTSAYRAAMVAVGALHKANRALEKNQKSKEIDADKKNEHRLEDGKVGENSGEDPTSIGAVGISNADTDMDTDRGLAMQIDETDESLIKETESGEAEAFVSLKRVALSARRAFENAVLSDPLISTFAPTLSRTMQQMNKGSTFNQKNTCPISISQAHSITIKEIAYLSLVNYADLILSCCSCGLNRKSSNNDILDRGAIRVLSTLITCQKCDESDSLNSSASLCVWGDAEKEEDSKKLALVSYVDASDLDCSDPSIWLKVACGARSLGRIAQEKEFLTVSNDERDANLAYAVRDNLSHSRLERYALERGLTALRPGIPCNRSISCAFREFEIDMLGSQNSYISFEKRCNAEKDLWTIDLPRYSWSTLGRLLLLACKTVNATSIQLKISPLLNLPPIAMELICEFLGAESKNLEATCRALSADIISVRALIEKNRATKLKQIEKEMHVILEKENKSGKDDAATNFSKDYDSQEDPGKQNRANRSSKRVRSQLITSGKQAERSAKRNSVQYCLVSSILPCTVDNPLYPTLSEEFSWNRLQVFASSSKITEHFFRSGQKDNGNSTPKNNVSSAKKVRAAKQEDCHLSKASLNEFIGHCSQSDMGALDMVYRFLAHVSCYIDEIYSSEQTRGMVLNSCIVDCKSFSFYTYT